MCRILHFLLSYDQLNITSVAADEVASRRRSLIEYARQGRPENPSYENSDDLLGVQEQADGSVVGPVLTQFAATRARAQADIMTATGTAREEKEAFRGHLPLGDDDDGPLKAMAKLKAKGKGGPQGETAPDK